MKQIGLALHNYHDAFNVFPPATLNPGSFFAWKFVATGQLRNHTGYLYLLPFVEQTALHDQIDFTQGTGIGEWVPGQGGYGGTASLGGSTTQSVLEGVKLNVYRCPSNPPWNEPYTKGAIPLYRSTNFTRVSYGFVSNGTEQIEALQGDVWNKITDQNKSAFGQNGAARLAGIKDGTSNTIVMIETPYRKRNEFYGPFFQGYVHTHFIVPTRYGINGFLANRVAEPWAAGSFHPAGCQVILGDASVHFVGETISTGLLEKLVSINGGEVAPLP